MDLITQASSAGLVAGLHAALPFIVVIIALWAIAALVVGIAL